MTKCYQDQKKNQKLFSNVKKNYAIMNSLRTILIFFFIFFYTLFIFYLYFIYILYIFYFYIPSVNSAWRLNSRVESIDKYLYI